MINIQIQLYLVSLNDDETGQTREHNIIFAGTKSECEKQAQMIADALGYTDFNGSQWSHSGRTGAYTNLSVYEAHDQVQEGIESILRSRKKASSKNPK